jgi:threonine/homoserine/homoserine lactone efflux protein
MSLIFFIKGTIIGFLIAAPVGPIGIKCIRKTLQFGRWSGLFSGLGAAFADMTYGIIAAFGLSLISDFLVSQKMWLRIIGGIFLISLGTKIFLSKPAKKPDSISQMSLVTDFISTYFLTLTNPMTLLAYLAVFAGVGLTNVHDNFYDASWLVFGVLIGSACWWLILSEGVTLFRHKVTHNVMVGINRIAGLVIIGFGVLAIVTTFIKFSMLIR